MENTKDRILFITHKEQNCGVADYGLRLATILKVQDWDITLLQADAPIEQMPVNINPFNYDVLLYNYHYATLPWLTGKQHPGIKHVALYHEAHMNFEPDVIIPVQDLPRPLFDDIEFGHPRNMYTVIGSFGFGFPDKNFPGLCQMVRNTWSKAIIRLNIPFAKFGDEMGELAKNEVTKCQTVLEGSEILLQVSHDYKEPAEMLKWLANNDINIFNYAPSHGRGLSSCTDYALSVRRPIGVSNSEMFRHLPKEICLDNVSIPELISRGIEPLKETYAANTNDKLADAIKSYL